METPQVVVGEDGSRSSGRALRWAFDWAQRVSGRVEVIRAWTLSTAPTPATWERGFVPPVDDFADAVQQQLARTVEPIAADYPGVGFTCRAVHGAAAPALLQASEHADLLVVGARGMGGFLGMLLGSVSESCVRHASCPVLVIRGREREAEGRTGRLDRLLEPGEPGHPTEAALLSELKLDGPQ